MLDRAWLDLKIRAARVIFDIEAPTDTWPTVLDYWMTALGDSDQDAVEAQLERCVRDEILPTPGAVWRALHSPVNDIGRVIEISADVTGVSRALLIGPRRSRSIAWPRFAAMAIASRCTGQSLSKIGRAFGHRDHSTVILAKRRAGELCASDVEFYAYHSEIGRRVARCGA